MKSGPSGVTAPSGFLAAGLHAGIKKTPALDLALVVSEDPGPIAGVFTTNRILAAPIQVCRAHLRRGKGQAIFINSGNANACTGRTGQAAAVEMARLAADLLGLPHHTVFVSSTGVIGQPLPMGPLRRGLPKLIARLRREGGREAARAIMTTDTRVKEAALSARIAGRTIWIGGMAKGSGMIHPDMATMLAFVTTNAAIDRRALQRALVTSVDQSFHRISVDGDTSTNDTVLCLANGAAGNPVLRAGSKHLAAFQQLLDRVCQALALQVCRDGEGATKLVRIEVAGARTQAEAKSVAKSVATSALVKTALFGEDANWGRIMAAVGRSGARIAPSKIRLSFDRVPIVKRGVSLGPVAERNIARVVKRKEFSIRVNLGLGSARWWIWTTDLSHEYVTINASYRS